MIRLFVVALVFGCAEDVVDLGCTAPLRGDACPIAYSDPDYRAFEASQSCPDGAERTEDGRVSCLLRTRVCVETPDATPDCGLDGYRWSPSFAPDVDLLDGEAHFAYGLRDGTIVSCRKGLVAEMRRLWQRTDGSLYHDREPESETDAPFDASCVH